MDSLPPPKIQKAIAFYLPQFHPVKENSEWWGPGFTEWTNVAKGTPNFKGHYQPHVPKDLGFYDLRMPSVMHQQVDLAKKYGIHGFCFYWYWFGGRRILEMPVEQFAGLDSDFPYCVCWANENWTRTWDGQSKRVLLGQSHSPEDDIAFIQALMPHFKNARYIRHEGKPVLLVYRVDLFPDMPATAKRWREEAAKNGIPELHLCAVQFYGIDDPRPWGFDAAVEFPPHNYIGSENRSMTPFESLNPNFTFNIADYTKIVAQSLARDTPDYELYRGIIPSWDNTARRQDNPHVIVNSSPELFQFWIASLVRRNKMKPKPAEFLFINAWNEWAEGCHLEPDLKYGHGFLEAAYKGLQGLLPFDGIEKALQKEDWNFNLFVESSRTLQAVVSTAQENRMLLEELHATEPRLLRFLKKFLKKAFVKKVLTKSYAKIKTFAKEG